MMKALSQKLAEENSRGLSDAAANTECRWEVTEWERQKQFDELTHLQTRGSELCLVILGPPRVRNHPSEGMQLMALRHSEMAGELATLRVTVPFVADSALGRSPGEIFRVEVVDELVAEFQRLDERCSQLERPP
jgi:hypothetical protein